MVSEMLSRIHIITLVEQPIDGSALESSLFVSYNIDLLSRTSIETTFLSIFSNKSSQPFSLTISYDKKVPDIDYWLEKLCLILSHPSYTRVDNKQLIGVFDLENVFINTLVKELENQGFFDLLFVDVTQNKSPSFVYSEDILTEEDFYNWYIQVLTNSSSLPDIFINFRDHKSINRFLELRKKTEEKFHTAEPKLYELIKQVYSKSEEISEHRQLINGLREDLSSKEAYLDYILGKFQQDENDGDLSFNHIMNIKKFYHYEYEILPLWYKRFGHIIKVILGRRTFRSLFNHNAKKYK
jgi:hypothetical protein